MGHRDCVAKSHLLYALRNHQTHTGTQRQNRRGMHCDGPSIPAVAMELQQTSSQSLCAMA